FGRYEFRSSKSWLLSNVGIMPPLRGYLRYPSKRSRHGLICGLSSNIDLVKKVHYITVSELGKIADQWVKDNPHNNGFAYRWIVSEPKDSAYPEIEQYFLNQGVLLNET